MTTDENSSLAEILDAMEEQARQMDRILAEAYAAAWPFPR